MTSIWQKKLGRAPLFGKYKICPFDIHPEEACELLIADPKEPGLMAVDCEHYNGRLYCPWSERPDSQKIYPVDIFGNPKTHGPFVRLIQVARLDGLTIIFDLKGLQKIPDCLAEMLTGERARLIAFAGDGDAAALANTDRRLEKVTFPEMRT